MTDTLKSTGTKQIGLTRTYSRTDLNMLLPLEILISICIKAEVPSIMQVVSYYISPRLLITI